MHGDLPGAQLPPENEPDKHLYFIHASMDLWLASRPPCECEALCECEDEPEDEFEV